MEKDIRLAKEASDTLCDTEIEEKELQTLKELAPLIFNDLSLQGGVMRLKEKVKTIK